MNTDLTLNITITVDEILNNNFNNFKKYIIESVENLLLCKTNIIFDYIDIIIDFYKDKIEFNNLNNQVTYLYDKEDIVLCYNTCESLLIELQSLKLTEKYNLYMMNYSNNSNLPYEIPNNYNLYEKLLVQYIGKNILNEKKNCFKNTIPYLLSYLLCKTRFYIHFDGNRYIQKIKENNTDKNFILNSINLFKKANHIAFISLARENQTGLINELVINYPNSFIYETGLICDGVIWNNGKNKYKIKGMLDNTKRQPQMSWNAFICDVEFVFGVGGENKMNSSSWLLDEWKAPKTVRTWGYYRVIHEYEKQTKVKELAVPPGNRLSMQRHRKRSEHWLVSEGTATVYTICPTSTDYELLGVFNKHQDLHIDKEQWHLLANETDKPLRIVEIQYGENCVEEDIERK